MTHRTPLNRSRVRVAAFLSLAIAAGGSAWLNGPSFDVATPAVAADAPSASALKLNKGDHIAIIGNSLADRMQHSNWFEALLYARYPDHELVIRNLAVTGDEIVTRARSENFGTPDDWLTKVKADVIFAFFGFNESFAGEAGLEKFKTDLDKYLKDTKAKNYSGKGSPRIVLVSPIAAEKHQDANYADPTESNKRLAMYTAAMADVAKANGVAFIDLYAPSMQAYREAARDHESLTINGVHLSDAGDKVLAPVLFRAALGESAPDVNDTKLLATRAAIADKNAQWHGRYRTVDGFNVYGGRSQLAFPSSQPGVKIKNYDVMQQEMSQRDVLTGNRDKVVWAAAKGQPANADDSNLPPVASVPTNKVGPVEGGAWPFLSGEEAISRMVLHAGCKVQLFADEKEFPALINPVQMAFDTKGRLWVANWKTYPERRPTDPVGDSLLIFEDTNNDGKADKMTPFLTGLNCPTGFQFYKDGVLLMQAPDLWFVRDTDGDGKGDWKERVVMGVDSADSHHTTNAMAYDPGGAVYMSDGVFHRSQVETASGLVRNIDGAIYRFEPGTSKFERYIAYGFANPHGKVFDHWGNDIVTDATGNANYFGPAFSGFIDFPAKHKNMKQFWARPSRPCPGTAMLTSNHFPKEFWGNFLNLNVIGFQGIYNVKVTEDGSGLKGETKEHLISSTDPNFRPTAAATGPDGALYFVDWHNPIIGHMQHHLRDPNRDAVHGRVYRITYEGRPLNPLPKIDGQSIPALLDLLKDPQNQVREWAKIELSKHAGVQVCAEAKKWAAALDAKDAAYEHHMMEALWVHQWHNIVDLDLLNRMLKSPEANARAAATRVALYWRDRVPSIMAILKTSAKDEHPRVRLEAVRAASFFKSSEAVDVALASVIYPADYYLEYTLGETMKQLEPVWKKALAEGQPIAADNPAGVQYLVGSATAAELRKMPRVPAVLQVMLTKADIPDADRLAALQELSDASKKSRPSVLLATLKAAPKDSAAGPAVARLLAMLPPEDLKPVREELAKILADKNPAALRRPIWAALVVADGSFDTAWAQADKSPATLVELLEGIPMILNAETRALAYDKVMPFLTEAPKSGGDNVRQAAIAAAVSMNHQPKPIASALAAMIKKRELVAASARGLRTLPRKAWETDIGGAVATDLVAWGKTLQTNQRTLPENIGALQLAADLVGLLPADQAAVARKELKSLRVAVFVLTTVREQMRYDTARLVVEAGKPFQIILVNDDFMPHNVVIVTPGAREKAGTAVLDMRPDQLDKKGRAFIPKLTEVLDGTKLLEAGQQETLKMTAPAKEGVYEYVCTYPGHWENMWGKLVVTKDVDAYLLANPDAGAPAAGAAHKHGAH